MSLSDTSSVSMETMRHQRQQPESFADLVRKARTDSEAEQPKDQRWPRPIRDGRWIDDNGTHWHIRGGQIQVHRRRLRRLLKRPDLRILHAYGLHPTEVSGRDRQALLEQVERYLAGEAHPHSEFRLAEFRDDNHHVMLVIEEDC
jgi:hypothetical protein